MIKRDGTSIQPYCALFSILLSIFTFCDRQLEVVILPPDELYGRLFHDVQSNRAIFKDSKTFPDCTPKYNPETIRKKYVSLTNRSDSALAQFVKDNFIIPPAAPAFTADSGSIEEHIHSLWEALKREPDKKVSGTLIPLPNAYIVPGGRFREVYYWDSYFTMLGLRKDGQHVLMKNIVDNFSWLIDTLGFIPNGNRTYYLSRSQPPFFSLMVSIVVQDGDSSQLAAYIPRLEKEYAFWMNGLENLGDSRGAYKRVVRLPDGSILNRYWDDKTKPRSESYREDIATANKAFAADSSLKKENVFRNLRAAAESGWDFSSRWLSADENNTFHLHTIHTTDIIPVDLNALLYHLEKMLYTYYSNAGTADKANHYKTSLEKRRKALYTWCWNSDSGFFFDYNFTTERQTGVISVAGFYPFFFNIADTADAPAAAGIIRHRLLYPGGVAATVNNTGQQWDKPNGWPPLQWITVTGLRNYGQTGLADTIVTRWCGINQKVYRSMYKMCEKYNVVDTTKESGGGEYTTQDGFGWTNGVFEVLCTSQ